MAKSKDGGKDDTKKKAPKDSLTFPTDSVYIQIMDSDGDTIRTMREYVKKGVNRIIWGLNQKTVRMPSSPKPEPGSPEPATMDALPGKYKVRVRYGKSVDSTTVNLVFDPRLAYTSEEIQANTKNLKAIFKKVQVATDAADRLREAKKIIEQISGVIKERTDSSAKNVKDMGSALQDSIKKINEMFVDREVQGFRGDPSLLQSQLNDAIGYAGSSWYAPGESQRIVFNQAIDNLRKVVDVVNRLFEKDWPKYKDAVDAAKISFFQPYEPIKVDN